MMIELQRKENNRKKKQSPMRFASRDALVDREKRAEKKLNKLN